MPATNDPVRPPVVEVPVMSDGEKAAREEYISANRAAEVELRLVVRKLRRATKRYEERLSGPARDED